MSIGNNLMWFQNGVSSTILTEIMLMMNKNSGDFEPYDKDFDLSQMKNEKISYLWLIKQLVI